MDTARKPRRRTSRIFAGVIVGGGAGWVASAMGVGGVGFVVGAALVGFVVGYLLGMFLLEVLLDLAP